MVFQNDILAGAAGAGGGYEIDQSIRFNDNDSAYLSRTSGSADSERKLASTSIWLKRSNLTARHTIYSVNPAGSNGAANQITMVFENSGTNGDCITYNNGAVNRQSTSVYRDVSGWYHFCQIFDTSQATAADRVKTYINGNLLTDINIGQDFSLNSNTAFGQNSVVHYLGRGGSTQYFDGYMAEIVFTVGQSVAVTDFGEYNDDGVWVPKAYAGTYGTNGFYITGEDSADLGADYSGNANDFTSSGLTSDDQVTDTPTDNYPTYNSISTLGTLSDGNLVLSIQDYACPITQSYPTSGIWQTDFELDVVSGSNGAGVGVLDYSLFKHRTNDGSYTDGSLAWGGSYGFGADGTLNSPSAYNIPYGSNWFTAGNIISIIYNADVGAVWFAINGTLQNSATGAEIEAGTTTNAAFTGLTGSIYTPFTWSHNLANSMILLNETQQSISGLTSAKLLSTANLPAPTITDGSAYFQTTLYTGDGSATQTITQSENSTFNPDFIWIKNRSNAYSHNINDAVRGYTGASPATAADVKVLASDATDKEGLGDTLTTAIQRGFVQSSTSNGFIVNKGTAGSQDGFYTNASGHTYAAWQWLAANGTASNTNGSITSTVSANTTAGFSVLTFAGSGGTGTVGHGLSQPPNFIIVKSRDTSNAWYTGSDFYTTWEYYQTLNSNAAQSAGSTVWNSTAPTSSVFSIGASLNTSAEDYVAYCWHSVEGFSKFGSYTGNGSTDGPFVWCGFRPAFVMFKKTSGTDSWEIFDNTRPGYNATGLGLFPNATDSESTGRNIDILSNGIKQRNANGTTNESGYTYIYMAFAEHPFGGDGVAPVPAR
jgi:hypothetical protein